MRTAPLGDQFASCFTSRMLTGFCALIGAVIGTIFVARRARQTAASAAAGKAVFFPVGATRPGDRRRYSLGRVQAGSAFQWEPRWSWTRLRALPTDLCYLCARPATFGEMWRIPIGTLVIECESSAGPVRLWAYPQQAVQVVEMIRRPGAPDLSKP
ncbi:hypothetical protein [Streptomyces chartreusis]|uniref:hypothetical protein n=1 Tax=Streptomyces chartreusis TaxID=1969 RepID=UPI0004C81CA2